MQFDYTTLEENFKKLPEEVQYALTSPKVSEDIQAIAQKNGLMLDQMETLYDITTYVMLGLLPSNKFTSTLARELNVSEKQAGLITGQISNEVFVNIRELMREYEDRNQSTYVTSLGNTQMNANTYPQSFRPVNNTTPQPTPTVTESPHADLEKAGGFTIEVAGNPTPNIEKPKPQPVETPKTQQPLPPNQPKAEIKTETVNQAFQPTNYYNFRNNQEVKIEDKKEEVAEKEVTDQKEGVVEKEITEDKTKTEEKEVYGTEEKTIVPGKIVFKHVQDTEIKPEPKTEVKKEEIIKPVEKTEEVETKKPLADYLVSKMNDKSTIPDNLPVEEVPKPVETVKETVVPPVVNEVKLAPTPKPVVENKPRAFDPYREIPN